MNDTKIDLIFETFKTQRIEGGFYVTPDIYVLLIENGGFISFEKNLEYENSFFIEMGQTR